MIETSWNNQILKITTKKTLYSSRCISSNSKFNKFIDHLITIFTQSDKNNSIKPLMCAGVDIII